ncbi:2-oxoglutarate dehydrogenase complex dihydrolipoyllysine-residue succinyltransferase [Paenibacillus arenilitoris]|uniref:Dihydrolipoyllysine-residue succinyltransferase component of 2-oxoglutarate dehydrogenase complex n=1 Tax=Paenibacillus arenilitoris TaxID=2772299 RepID=A0A927CGI1_9BACL|nr:2-oxoglutarate dehydrogenase complex dihydrolipoyllysine-residue succinyltransferase [Paenibacillus arenilitoris]MBD2867674.1 2-oxoglutarate dehydrogenase complex dihydrolipoyllysine-residue succinyltransferase [Paenibacillus arenilitoris]
MAEIIVPELGESISEGTITKWFVKEGDSVNQGDVLLELETDKVNIEISADNSGVISRIAKQDGEVVLVGEAIGSIGDAPAGGASAPAAPESPAPAAPAPAADPAPAPASAAPAAPPSAPAAAAAPVINASPAARKRAREQGIDLAQAAGQAPAAAPAPAVATPVSSAPLTQAEPAAASPNAKPTERKRMSRRRITIANRLVEAQRTAAMLTTFNEVDMTAILDLRKRRKQSFFEKNDVNLGFMSFFTKAVVGALKAFPLLNAEIEGEDIIVKKFYDIGIAVSAKEGLVVPVVRDADRLSFAEIEKSIVDLATKARANTLSIGDLQGGSFTITNGGVFGSLLSTPILNTPQVGILGMHKIQVRPVAIDDERMENRPMMYIALSYDHRIVDGSEAVRFLVTVKELLEDPEQLLLQG